MSQTSNIKSGTNESPPSGGGSSDNVLETYEIVMFTREKLKAAG